MTAATIVADTPDVHIERRYGGAHHSLSLLRHIYVERGTKADWDLLHELHYKSAKLGIGPRFWRAVLDDGVNPPQVVGVMVFTVPKPLDSARNLVLPHCRPNRNGIDNRAINQGRMAWLNANVILSSRTVVDTMYRGAGIAYRFKNLAYRMMGMRYVEARSSMSRFNPFSEKAGMRYVHLKHAPGLDDGLEFFTRWFASPPFDIVALLKELKEMPQAARENAIEACRDFYYKHSSMEKSGDNRLRGRTRVDAMDVGHLLRQIQQLVFGASIYAFWKNPDGALDPHLKVWAPDPLPARLPLIAFDWQGTGEKLNRDKLKEWQACRASF